MGRKDVLKIIGVVVVMIFAVIGVISVIGGDDSSSSDTSEQANSEENQDTPPEQPLALIETYPWSGETDPYTIGVEINGYISTDINQSDLQRQLADLDQEIDGGVPTDEQREQYDSLVEQLQSQETSAYVSDGLIEQLIITELQDDYKQWRDEYYDEDGNQIKDIPEVQDSTTN